MSKDNKKAEKHEVNSITLLGVVHPYYCSDSNYYSNEPGATWENATVFLDEYEDADEDMNLCFRWDVLPKDDEDKTKGYYGSIFLMHQRKGIFAPHHIKTVEEHELDRLRCYLEKHWKTLCAMWNPISPNDLHHLRENETGE